MAAQRACPGPVMVTGRCMEAALGGTTVRGRAWGRVKSRAWGKARARARGKDKGNVTTRVQEEPHKAQEGTFTVHEGHSRVLKGLCRAQEEEPHKVQERTF